MITTKIDPLELDQPITMVQVHSILRASGIPIDTNGEVTEGKLTRYDRLEPGIVVYTYEGEVEV